MIFVTVGGQLPFDRLIATVDDWANQHPEREIFAQIGRSHLTPRFMKWVNLLASSEYAALARRAEMIVAHAGMGSVLTALELGKPLLVMPRRAALKEHRTDHQMSTAKALEGRAGIVVAYNEHRLREKLDEMSSIAPAQMISPYADEGLLGTIRDFLGSA